MNTSSALAEIAAMRERAGEHAEPVIAAHWLAPVKQQRPAAIPRPAQRVASLSRGRTTEPSPALTELADALGVPWAECVVRIVIEPTRVVVDYA